MEKVLLLISGGIDSPVAGRMLMDQDFDVVGLHLSNEPFTDDTPERKSLESLRIIGCRSLIVINVSSFLAEIAARCSRKLYFVISKRLFYRIAELVAKEHGCSFIATGENLGQVSSQTLSNLSVIQKASGMAVLQPLLCLDKAEIAKKAEELGTFSVCKGPEMCSVLGPKMPATRSSLSIVESEEAKLDYPALMEEALATKRIIDL